MPDKTKEEAAREKFIAKIVKEGGKKGVEIEGASDMGGLDFFCTTMELPGAHDKPRPSAHVLAAALA